MALKFSATNGGFIQDTSMSPKIEFNIFGDISQTLLEPVGAPMYNRTAYTISSAILVVENAEIGSFNVQIVSYNTDGTSATTHISQTITTASAGTVGLSLTLTNATIAADKIVKILVQYVSGSISSNISVTLE